MSELLTAAQQRLLDAAYSVRLHAGPADEHRGRNVEIGVVVVGDAAYVRAFRGTASAWYRAAVASGAGTIAVDGGELEVEVEVEVEIEVEVDITPLSLNHVAVLDNIDDAYRRKYGDLSAAATGDRIRAATLRVIPRAS
jgi:hypothetical protein